MVIKEGVYVLVLASFLRVYVLEISEVRSVFLNVWAWKLKDIVTVQKT